jgi:alanyl-tRNA synthetase
VVEKGELKKGDAVRASIDVKRRLAIAKNHTATHLLHKALRNVLGSHVNQAGSLVEPDRLRFDFTHFSPVTGEELQRVEEEVNERIMENIPVETMEMDLEEAKKQGAAALFGEKYEDVVRVVKIGDYSMELCGGTHLNLTSQAAFIKILGESGVAAGVRRIEALTGIAAVNYLNEKEKLLGEVAAALKAAPQDAVKKAESLMSELRNAEKEIENLRNKSGKQFH